MNTRFLKVRARRGITLAEVMIMVAVIGGIAVMGTMTVRLMSDYQRQARLLQVERDAHVALTQMTTDVFNSSQIVFMSSDTLAVNTFNFPRYGFGPASSHGSGWQNLFVNVGTITYHFNQVGQQTSLQRTSAFNGVNKDKVIFRNQLVPVVEAQSNTWLFVNPFSLSGATESVRISLRFQPKFLDNNKIQEYWDEASIRGLKQ